MSSGNQHSASIPAVELFPATSKAVNANSAQHLTPTPAIECTPSSAKAAAAAPSSQGIDAHLAANRNSNLAGGNASSAPGPSGPAGSDSTADVEAMRNWW